ncbi:hypothetical protein O1W71_11920 [Microbacterium sp. H37-C3]|uniref:hypothetical protein n=1 Tax=Microbacterium sp. H37-C3 TaxID=3004354 RepID=UPI0022AF3E94|nr:hypothetical protein [Microbacterium sp. H37-C3]MCZ4068377.1 hypothetical protein [Microbacterium sp. H37-C3]
MKRGYITLAFGSEHYLRIARNLARSLRRSGSTLPLAIITDLDDHDLTDFDATIPLDGTLGNTLLHKLSLDTYSPFEETIFLDSDCLVARNPDYLFDSFPGRHFTVVGDMVDAGEWFGTEIEELRHKLGIADKIPKFNSGFIYWISCAETARLFAGARELWDDYDDLGFGQFRTNLVRADEPLFAIAMARNGVAASPDDGTVMNTPIGLSGRVRLNLSKQLSQFVKHGRSVHPAVVHFCGFYRFGGSYRREAFYLSARANRTELVARRLANFIYAIPVALDHGAVWAGARALFRTVRAILLGGRRGTEPSVATPSRTPRSPG